jgi:hypothetical protein
VASAMTLWALLLFLRTAVLGLVIALRKAFPAADEVDDDRFTGLLHPPTPAVLLYAAAVLAGVGGCKDIQTHVSFFFFGFCSKPGLPRR